MCGLPFVSKPGTGRLVAYGRFNHRGHLILLNYIDILGIFAFSTGFNGTKTNARR